MKKQGNNVLKGWLLDNAWNLLLTLVFIVGAWAIAMQKIEQVIASQISLEKKINAYPSEDWFNLKFETQDDKLDTVIKKLDEHLKETN